uniref:Uncharacterized protein n=1 Tax=Anguilla anguilla TaxID=7936 RepID=A0A0E9XEL9_ANGAN
MEIPSTEFRKRKLVGSNVFLFQTVSWRDFVSL